MDITESQISLQKAIWYINKTFDLKRPRFKPLKEMLGMLIDTEHKDKRYIMDIKHNNRRLEVTVFSKDVSGSINTKNPVLNYYCGLGQS